MTHKEKHGRDECYKRCTKVEVVMMELLSSETVVEHTLQKTLLVGARQRKRTP